MMMQRSIVVFLMAVFLCISITMVLCEDLRVAKWSNKMARYTVRMVPIDQVEAQVEDQIMGGRNRFQQAPMWPGYGGYYRRAPYGY